MSTFDPGSGVGGSDAKPAPGSPPPEDPEFFTGWAKENAKEFVKNANSALGQLLTLSTSLLGGAIAFWNNIPLDAPYKYAVVSALLLTVLICLASAMPTEGSFDPKSPSDARRHMEDLLAYKRRRLRFAKNALMLSIVVMALGLAESTGRFGARLCATVGGPAWVCP